MSLNKRSASIVLGFSVVWIALAVSALTWGFVFDWPDALHVDHGFPLVWATHTLSTIAGAADIWQVDMTALLIDLLLWLGLMVVAVAIMLYAFSKRSQAIS